MKKTHARPIALFCSVVTILACGIAGAAGVDRGADEQAIRKVLEKLVESLKNRDVDGVKSILHSSAIAVEASGENAGIELLDPNKPERLVPPEGNKDWERITLSEPRIQVSPTHPSIAAVSFVFKVKLRKEELKGMQDALSKLDEGQRKQLEKLVKDGAVSSSMFALMAKKQGQWKIVSMTFPK